jgi:hypothetical protein
MSTEVAVVAVAIAAGLARDEVGSLWAKLQGKAAPNDPVWAYDQITAAVAAVKAERLAVTDSWVCT